MTSMKSMKIISFIGALVIALLCSTQKTKEFYIHESVPEYMVIPILKASNRINEIAGKQVLIYKGISNEKYNKNFHLINFHNVIYLEKNYIGTRGKRSMAFAQIRYLPIIGIYCFDIFLNGQLYDFQDTDLPQIEGLHYDNIVDLEGVMLHEFLHVLDIEHSEEEKSIMSPHRTKGYDYKKRKLTNTDILNIKDAT